jgi:hypothetical protein
MPLNDDRVCPSCQVLLPDGARICSKCGQQVEPVETHNEIVDFIRKIRPSFVQHLGRGVGMVVVGILALLFLLIMIGLRELWGRWVFKGL